MVFKDELNKVLAQYKAHCKPGARCETVIFFQEDNDSPIEHLLCHAEQLPAVMDYTKWYRPQFLSAHSLGEPIHTFYQPPAASENQGGL